MDIENFIKDQIKKTYDPIMGNILRFYGDCFAINYISALSLFGEKIRGEVGDDNGISVNDIREIFSFCLSEFDIVYSQPTKKRDKYSEIQLFRAVIFYIHASCLFEDKKYNESVQALMNTHECFGASKVFKSADLSYILDDDYKFTVASKGGKAKAKKEAEEKAPVLKKLEQRWDKGGWTDKGRGKYVKFADWAIHSEENEGLPYETIRKHISKYDKSK